MFRALTLLAPLAQPVGVHAPKGFPGEAVHHAGTFLYAGYYQDSLGASAGAGAKMLQANPALAAADAHTLGEIGVQSADNRQIVEIGWRVDVLVNHDAQPRLFVFHWVDGQPTCYNGCGFVETSTTHRPGMRVTPGQVADYAIELRGSDWWLAYQGVDLGYFPGSLWPSGFTAAHHVQWFGEVAAEGAEPCTEMGTGVKGSNAAAAARCHGSRRRGRVLRCRPRWSIVRLAAAGGDRAARAAPAATSAIALTCGFGSPGPSSVSIIE